MTPSNIILAVRDRLGDAKAERWSDETLILYVSMCQTDICMFTHFYRQVAQLNLVEGTLIYDLPTNFLALNRLEYAGQLFPVETRNTIDKQEAKMPCALKDNLQYNQIEIILAEQNDLLIEALNTAYGVVSDAANLDDVFGVLSDVGDTPVAADTAKLMVFYTAVPPMYLSGDLERPLIVPDIWFSAFLHYVCGTALQDDNDSNNIQRGEMELQKYARVLSHIMKVSSKDFTSNMKTKMTTSYRRV